MFKTNYRNRQKLKAPFSTIKCLKFWNTRLIKTKQSISVDEELEENEALQRGTKTCHFSASAVH